MSAWTRDFLLNVATASQHDCWALVGNRALVEAILSDYVLIATEHREASAKLEAARALLRDRRELGDDDLTAVHMVACPVHVGAVHGGEAEELRSGIEGLLKLHESVPRLGLIRLLDRVDARDSLAHLERHDVATEAL